MARCSLRCLVFAVISGPLFSFLSFLRLNLHTVSSFFYLIVSLVFEHFFFPVPLTCDVIIACTCEQMLSLFDDYVCVLLEN